MAAHRYWRVNCSFAYTSSNSLWSAAEVEMAETVGGANACSGGTAAASSSFDAVNQNVSKLFDGTKTGTNWWASAASSMPAWASYDFGSGVTKDINEVRIFARADSAPEQVPAIATVEFSDDNSTWTPYWNLSQQSNTNVLSEQITHVNPTLWPATYWDPAFPTAGAGTILDDRNLQARTTSSTASARSSRVISSALTYFEFTIGATLTGSSRVGICNSSFASGTLLGADNNGVGYDAGGTVKLNNSTLSTIMTYTTGDRIGVAVDTLNQKLWFRKNNGNWNNDVIGNQNPVGNVGGISYSTIASAAQLRLSWGGTVTSGGRAAFASTAWTDTAPTGYVSIDTFGFTAVSHTEYDLKTSTPASPVALLSETDRMLKSSTPAAPVAITSFPPNSTGGSSTPSIHGY